MHTTQKHPPMYITNIVFIYTDIRMSHNRKKRTGFQISTLYIFVYFIHANIFDDLFIHLRQIHVSVAVRVLAHWTLVFRHTGYILHLLENLW